MVIGHGMIARRFSTYLENNDFLIFASGVSDSKLDISSAFERERLLLLNTIKENIEKHLVYFSTCSVSDPDIMHSPYAMHKLEMEKLIANNARTFSIFRLSNVVGFNGNPKTILNYFVHSVKTGTSIELWRLAERNLIDIDDVYELVNYILANKLYPNQILNIAQLNNCTVVDIFNSVEKFLEIKGHCTIVEKGAAFKIDTQPILGIREQLNLSVNSECYIDDLLNKYY